MKRDAVAVNSRDTRKAREAYLRLPADHPARLAHAGLADPAAIAAARSARRSANRRARKARQDVQ